MPLLIGIVRLLTLPKPVKRVTLRSDVTLFMALHAAFPTSVLLLLGWLFADLPLSPS